MQTTSKLATREQLSLRTLGGVTSFRTFLAKLELRFRDVSQSRPRVRTLTTTTTRLLTHRLIKRNHRSKTSRLHRNHDACSMTIGTVGLFRTLVTSARTRSTARAGEVSLTEKMPTSVILLHGSARVLTGIQHGGYHVFEARETPMSNFFVSMLNTVDVTSTSFSDSTGKLPAIFA